MILAIKSGSDWYDASVDFLVIPEGGDVQALRAQYEQWYSVDRLKNKELYESFYEWLKKRHGLVEPNEDQLMIDDNDV